MQSPSTIGSTTAAGTDGDGLGAEHSDSIRCEDYIFKYISVMPEPGGGPLAPPIFGRSVNPISTGEGRLSPPITTGNPQCFSPSGITAYVCTK